MTTSTSTSISTSISTPAPTAAPTATTRRSLYRWTGLLLIFEALLFFVPVIVLGNAINWPASLNEPASVNLPLIAEQAGAVQFGYFIYLIYSILFWPISLLTVRVVAGRNDYGPLLQMAVGFGIASAVLRCLGIIRWLVPMPVLAQQYVNPASSEATREAIVVIYQMLNDYAGSVGEVLGVSLFAALWLLLLSIAAVRGENQHGLPRWVGLAGLATSFIVALPILEMFGFDLGPLIAITVTIFLLWLLATGIVLLRKKSV